MNKCINFDDSVKLDTLLRHVNTYIDQLPYELGVDLLRQAFTTFSRRTCMLASELSIDAQDDVTDYMLNAPEGYEIYMIRSAGMPRAPILTPKADYWYLSSGTRFAVIGNKIILFSGSAPTNEGDAFSVVATVIPNECVTTIPREISVPFGMGIAKGALAEAFNYRQRPWYDPQLARTMKLDFNYAINAGLNLNLMNRGGSDMRMRGKPWV